MTHPPTRSHRGHDHTFGQDVKRPGESRTILVILLTASTMMVEIGAGIAFGSMALLADGLHMASHATALAISALAYVYVRRHASDPRFSFGAGKVNALAGFTGAVLLALFALLMAGESIGRLVSPVSIAFNQAIGVAILGLLVNGASVFLLGHRHEDGDFNLRAAYLHVLADALTSILAIVALLAGKYFGFIWMDPVMGVVGAILVARWSVGLVRATSRVLLDRQGPQEMRQSIQEAIERDSDDRVIDLHLWCVGPDIYSLLLSIDTDQLRTPDDYKRMLPRGMPIVHTTVEVHR